MLRATCEIEDTAINAYGWEFTENLHRRLADLRAAKSPNSLPVGNPNKLDDFDNQFKLDLYNGYRLIFCSNHVKHPLLKSGKIDWSKVIRIKILAIEKSHEQN